MTHVRAVRKIVAANDAPEQLVHVGGFERRMAAHVEHDRFRIAAPEFIADHAEGFFPRDGQVSICIGVPFQRMGQTAEAFKLMIRPGFKVSQRMIGKELERYSFAG